MPNNSDVDKKQCYVHDRVGNVEVVGVRENVCAKNLPLIKHSDNRDYCLLHLPSEDKDIDKFEEIVEKRLIEIWQQIDEIKKNSIEQYNQTEIELIHDFRYVWFPSSFNFFSEKTIEAKVDFSYATFFAQADFWSTTFFEVANFKATIFKANVSFNSAIFWSGADFREGVFEVNTFFSWIYCDDITYFNDAQFKANADFNKARFKNFAGFANTKFLAEADFRWNIFGGNAHFNKAQFGGNLLFFQTLVLGMGEFSRTTFSAIAHFKQTTFYGVADFSGAIFDETSQTLFEMTSFQKKANFQKTTVKGYLYFEAGEGKFFDGEWLEVEKTEPKKTIRLTSVFENTLEFAHIRAEKPERITFNKTRLRPNWFINADPRKFVFTDIAWENHKAAEINLVEELTSLADNGYKEPHNYQLLSISFRNLAANAEENNRFEDASNFRESAFETERLERKKRVIKWWGEEFTLSGFLLNFWDKLKTVPYDFAHFAYRWTSSYGESWGWATSVLLLIVLLIFPIVYMLTDFQYCPKEKPLAISINEKLCKTGGLSFGEAITHSLTTATLQNVEYRKPLTGWGELWIILEKIFAPLQAALLALAIRRKFMR